MIRRLLVYAVVPALLTLLQSGPAELAQPRTLAIRFVTFALVGVCIGAVAEGILAVAGARVAAAGWRRSLFLVGVVLVSTLAGGELAARVLAAWRGWSLAELRLGIWRIGVVVCALVVVAQVVYDRLRERARQTELDAEHARQAALRAQLQALQARINPHFLFNGLNSVAALIEDDPAAAEAAVLSLSRAFRYALDGSRRARVTLAEELTALRSYLAIEVLRFGERLRVDEEIDDAAAGAELPPMVLQPLVENAIVHGIAGRRDGGRVRIRARVEDGALVLEVSSPLPETPTPPGSGTALADLRARLALLYGDRGQLAVGPSGDEFRATVRLPA